MGTLADEGLDFVERCSRASAAAAAADFLTTVGGMGFDAAACGAWVGVGAGRKYRFFFINWPADYLDFYRTNRLFEHDMMPIEARRHVGPFWFSHIVERGKLTDKQKQLVGAFERYGWKDCFAVPIHGPGGMQGLVSMATRKALSFSVTECGVLEVMARAVWERCRVAEGFGVFDPDRPKLSTREIECLQWAATGKSDGDIATLVGIRPATAHFHIEQAKRRLGVKTRAEAVAVGVLHGVI